MKNEYTLFDCFIDMMIKYKTMASVITMAWCGLVISVFSVWTTTTSMEVVGAIIICALSFAMMVICHVTDFEKNTKNLVNKKRGS